jgi:hypothetical protein
MGKYELLTTLQLDVANFKSGVKSAVKETDNLKTGVSGAAKSITDSFKDISTMGVGQMKRELASLKNISFAGKTKEEIAAINLQIGRLMDSMGDLRASQKVLGTEMSSVMLQGAQAVGAFVEVGFGVATMFGASEEASKKYQAVMVNMIGIMQGLATIQSLVSSGELAAIANRIKAGVVTAALAVKTALVTAAQWAWNVALAANPIGLIILGVAALTAGIIALVKWMKTDTEEVDKNTEAEKKRIELLKKSKEINDELANTIETKTIDSTIAQKVEIESLILVINESNRSLKDKEAALKKLIAIDPQFLKGLNMSNIATAEGAKIIDDYITKLDQKARAEAAAALKVDMYKEQLNAQLSASKALRTVNDLLDEQIALEEKYNGVHIPKWDKEREALQAKIDEAKAAYAVADTAIMQGTVGFGTLNQIIMDFIDVTDQSTKANNNNNKSLEEKNKILKDIAAGKFDFMPESDKGGSIEGLAKYIVENEAEKNKALEESNKETEALLAEGEEMYSMYYARLAGINISKALEPFKKANEEIQKQTNVFADSIMNLLGNLTEEIDAAFERFFDKALTPKERKTEFGRGILTAMGEFMSELGKQLIVLGGLAELVQVALATAFTNPVSAGVLIGAGIALIAGGAALKGYAAKGFRQEGYEDGGIVGGTLYTGDQVLARVNSKEMILNQAQQAELFKIANGGSSWGAGEVEFKIKGTELVGVLSNYNRVLQKTR